LSRADSGTETSEDNNGTGGQGDPIGGSGGDIAPPDPGTGGAGSGGSGGMLGTGGAGSGGAVGSGGTIGTGGSGGRAPDGGTAGSGGASGTGGANGTGGASGTGGTPAIDGCNRSTWTIKPSTLCDTAACTNISAGSKDPSFAIDGDLGTRYTSGRPQGSAGAETVVLTFPHSVTLTGIHLVTTSAGDGPANYKVEFATTGTNFIDFAPAAAAAGADDLTVKFPAATAMKAFRITQTGSKAVSWWSIHELTLTGCTN
jgi:hypothetical protein